MYACTYVIKLTTISIYIALSFHVRTYTQSLLITYTHKKSKIG